jgi:hypothetical protein
MAANEQHYTLNELSKKWHLSVTTILRWCDEHGGVLVLDRPETLHKRGYRTIRVPESTADEIYSRHFVPSGKRREGQWSENGISGQRNTNAVAVMPIARPAPMHPAPEITIFTRHSRDCRHRRNEFFQLCDCPKSFSFKDLGRLCTVRSGTRSWNEAEEMKQKAIGLVLRG